jgi:hypothetical protein
VARWPVIRQHELGNEVRPMSKRSNKRKTRKKSGANHGKRPNA